MTNIFKTLLSKYGVLTLTLRVSLLFITSIWFAFFPIYLAVIYMFHEGFFSYDFFIDGIFGVNTFLFVLLVFITVFSIHLWGFIYLFSRAKVENGNQKKKTCAYLFASFALLWSGVFHYVLYGLANSVGDGNALFGISLLGLAIVLVFTFNLGKPWSDIALDWKSPVIMVFLTATIPVVQAEEAARLVGYALKNFAIGGGVLARVYINNDHKNAIFCGPLTLLTPKNAYFRDGLQQQRMIVIADGVSILTKKNHAAKEMAECLANLKSSAR